jgi:hypothetical protein
MHTFQYRDPRFSCDIPVRLIFNDSTLAARCTEISNNGMKVEIEHPQQVSSHGRVSVDCEGQTIEFHVRFAYVQDSQAGLDLIYTNDADRKTMVDLVKSLVAVQGGKIRAI